MKRSSRLERRTPMPRPSKPMRRTKRSAAETLRIYGGEPRIQFVASLPCSVMGCGRRPSENAHAVTGGTGRKADAATILPLCGTHHRELHQVGVRTFEALHHLSLEECARQTDAAWQREQERVGLTHISAIVPGVLRAIEDGEAC